MITTLVGSMPSGSSPVKAAHPRRRSSLAQLHSPQVNSTYASLCKASLEHEPDSLPPIHRNVTAAEALQRHRFSGEQLIKLSRKAAEDVDFLAWFLPVSSPGWTRTNNPPVNSRAQGGEVGPMSRNHAPSGELRPPQITPVG